jgi:hypothetical protein
MSRVVCIVSKRVQAWPFTDNHGLDVLRVALTPSLLTQTLRNEDHGENRYSKCPTSCRQTGKPHRDHTSMQEPWPLQDDLVRWVLSVSTAAKSLEHNRDVSFCGPHLVLRQPAKSSTSSFSTRAWIAATSIVKPMTKNKTAIAGTISFSISRELAL